MKPKEKVAQLRLEMQKQNIDVFIVFSADPHLSEYLPKRWMEREWLTGFTGSAGFTVITQEKAGLWTDGRYFTQAIEELKGSGIQMYKDKVSDAVPYIDWIIEQTKEGANIAVNAMATSIDSWKKLNYKLSKNNRNLLDRPLLENVWTDRGEPSKNPIFVQPLERAGKSVEEKLNALREKMKEKKATAHIISALDDVAWTLNLRGSDIDYNPVFLGYVYLTNQEAVLYVGVDQLDPEALQLMEKSGVAVKPYKHFFDDLQNIKNEQIMIAKNCNQAVLNQLQKANKIIEHDAPGNLMKAIKNETELEGFQKVMVRDGVAMVNFLYWLTHNVGKQELTEYDIGLKLQAFRAQQKNFIGESFDSIVGYKGNGAIIHYSAPKEGSAQVEKEGSILIDSGGQYLEGTTDITRTIPLGQVSAGFKKDYTTVLKAYIALTQAKFPKGTRGEQVDILARLPLWKQGKDFNHGTGHGIGSFLNVHEGPQSIRKEHNSYVLQTGMVMSNEPGYYIEGEYGIRHENLMAVKVYKKTEWNAFYGFETLTLCPFFTKPLVKEMLTSDEVNWLNKYHKMCKTKLAPLLDGAVKKWFLELVNPL